jgi:hypothetical protein
MPENIRHARINFLATNALAYLSIASVIVRKSSKTLALGHHFIASLSVADMLLGFVVMVPRLIDQIYGEWVFGYFLCQVRSLMRFPFCLLLMAKGL